MRARSASSASATYRGDPAAATTPGADAGMLTRPDALRARAGAIEQRGRRRRERGHGFGDPLVARLGGGALAPAVVELLDHHRRLPLAERLVPRDRRHVEAGALRVARDDLGAREQPHLA